MASVKRYHVFQPEHSDPVYRSLWGQVIGTYINNVGLTIRYEQYAGNSNGAVIGKLSANGKTLTPAAGGLDYTLTPPRHGEGWLPLPPPPDGFGAMVDTATLPTYDPKTGKPVDIGTPPIGTTPPPTTPPPPGGEGWEWTAEKDRNFRAWALMVDERLARLETGAPPVVTPPGVPPPVAPPQSQFCYQVTFAVSMPVPPAPSPGATGGRVRLSSGSWFRPGQTNRFGEAVPEGFIFAVVECGMSNKNRDPSGSSGVSIDGIWTLRDHNPNRKWDVPPKIPAGTVIDGTLANDSTSGPTNMHVDLHGWYYMPGHEPACVRG